MSALVPGWRSAAFPLNATDDDETPPFPIDVALALTGGSERDDLASGRPLVLYRILRDDGEGAGNLLRITKDAAGVTIRF